MGGCVKRIKTEREWHRFWQNPGAVPAVVLDGKLLDSPLFGRQFELEDFLERVFRRYTGVVFVELDGGTVVASVYGWIFVRNLGLDPNMFCREGEYDVKSLIDTIITGKEVR